MGFDALVASPGRLSILAALAGEGRQSVEFIRLRAATRLTDGNLAAHARRLQSGGLVRIDKQFEAGKPVTRFTLTAAGKQALQEHLRRVTDAITLPAPNAVPVTAAAEDDWVD